VKDLLTNIMGQLAYVKAAGQVREEGEVKFLGALHDLAVAIDQADAPVAPAVPVLTDDMIDRANAEADTHIDVADPAERRTLVAAIMRAGLGIAGA
jgi:hypothetical protein